MKIAVAGVGYVGLSLAVLLSQRHEVMAVSTTPAKVEKINSGVSPIKDKEIEDFLEGVPEGSKLKESVPSEFASDDDMTIAWQDALDSAKVAAGAGE